MGWIYKITNTLNKKVYIGQTTQKNINSRFRTHLSHLRNDKSTSPHLQRSFNKYGEKNFKFELIENFDDALLNDMEEEYIDWIYNSRNRNIGYNIRAGGYNAPLSEEHKKNISKNHARLSGKNHPMYQREFTEEHRKNISKNHARLSGEDHPHYGKNFSDKNNPSYKHDIVNSDIKKLYEDGYNTREIASICKCSQGCICKRLTKIDRADNSFNYEKLKKKNDYGRNHYSKLKKSDVIEIKKLLKTKEFTQPQIAKKFGVKRAAISKINTGRTWKDVV